MIFDTHSHYDDEQFDIDRDELLMGLASNGVSNIVNVGASLRGCRASVEIAERYPFAYCAVGVHPDEVGSLEEQGIEEIRELLSSEKCVAVGEIGLDYHWMVQPKEIQEKWFRAQINLAREYKKPVIIHSRDAAEDTFTIMSDEHAEEIGGVIHCFSYSPEMAKKYVDMGFYIGVGGVLTYKNGRKLKEVAAATPLERIVLETDCPYLSPSPHRGERNNSAYIAYVVTELAGIKGISEEEVIRITEENAKRLYRL